MAASFLFVWDVAQNQLCDHLVGVNMIGVRKFMQQFQNTSGNFYGAIILRVGPAALGTIFCAGPARGAFHIVAPVTQGLPIGYGVRTPSGPGHLMVLLKFFPGIGGPAYGTLVLVMRHNAIPLFIGKVDSRCLFLIYIQGAQLVLIAMLHNAEKPFLPPAVPAAAGRCLCRSFVWPD